MFAKYVVHGTYDMDWNPLFCLAQLKHFVLLANWNWHSFNTSVGSRRGRHETAKVYNDVVGWQRCGFLIDIKLLWVCGSLILDRASSSQWYGIVESSLFCCSTEYVGKWGFWHKWCGVGRLMDVVHIVVMHEEVPLMLTSKEQHHRDMWCISTCYWWHWVGKCMRRDLLLVYTHMIYTVILQEQHKRAYWNHIGI